MKIISAIILMTFFSGFVFSQATTSTTVEKDKNIFQMIDDNNSSRSSVTINQEYRLKLMMENHLKINKKQDGCEGYRLRIYSAKGNNARANALEMKSKFMKQYPYTKSYLSYETPNFKILVGDFRTKSEAEKFRREIVKDFPDAFIVKGIIEFPKL